MRRYLLTLAVAATAIVLVALVWRRPRPAARTAHRPARRSPGQLRRHHL
jgi:hypothetical protein